MVRLQNWRSLILILPIVGIVGFIIAAAVAQIHAWRLNWIWAVFTLVFLGWRWLLVRWTKPTLLQVNAVVEEVQRELEASAEQTVISGDLEQTSETIRVETALSRVLAACQNDAPIWEDLQTFWQRCQDLVVEVARIYHPEVKYPLLNIYIPQAYGLIRGTVDDVDRWMQKISPVLSQVSIGQVYEGYEIYQKLEPSARKLIKALNLVQWLLNPLAAVTNTTTRRYSEQANQQLLVNLSQLLREVALRNLCRQAAMLYGGNTLPASFDVITPTTPTTKKTQTLREILTTAEPVTTIEQKPVNLLLVGRTGAGKSSLINTLFQADLAAVDVLPSTDTIMCYHWQTQDVEALNLWDTPGYEQVKRTDLRDQVLDYARTADLLVLVTPALDPALQMDVDFLKEIKAANADLPCLAVVNQVDKLRPIREWEPPYDWEWGERPKEIAIREATQYRAQILGQLCDRILPIVTQDQSLGRNSWGIEQLSMSLFAAIAPAKQLRLARFLRNLDTKVVAGAKIIDNYTLQMTTTQGLTALLKSPILQFISTLSTGSPALAMILAEKIPVEQLPVVIGKLQMGYELFNLLNEDATRKFDLMAIWGIILENPAPPVQNAWAFGHGYVEYLTQNLSVEQLRDRIKFYLEK